MDPSRRSRKAPTKSELYSTVVIHDDDDDEDDYDAESKNGRFYAANDDLQNDAIGEDDDSLPPLLKHLPKDFGGAAPVDDDEDGDFGTMIIKTKTRTQNKNNRNKSSSVIINKPFSDFKRTEDDDDDNDFGTFVVKSSERESESVRRRSGGYEDSTMGRAVASMQRFSSNSSLQAEEARQQCKISSSSIPDSVTREDPTTKYELLNELGKGSYGSVYKARDFRTSELVAIKVISLTEGEEGYEEIRGEIEMLQQCNHPNVVRYLGSYQGEEYLWIVMEYCGGGSVADLMNVTEEALEEYQIAYICREALKGLAYLHSIFKVHRDIKGGNILLTEQGEVKLGDFGVAAQLTRTMSKRNTFIGTPHWMAPEVIQESRYDGKNQEKEQLERLAESCSSRQLGLKPQNNLQWNLVRHNRWLRFATKEERWLQEQAVVRATVKEAAAAGTRRQWLQGLQKKRQRPAAARAPQKKAAAVDVWALGVSAIEMAEGLPPRSTVHPMRVLFMISIEPAPMLEDKEKWSLVFHDFVAKCLTKEPRSRPTAAEMLKHKFIERCKCGASAMLPKIEKSRQIRASMAQEAENVVPDVSDDAESACAKLNEDYGDTVPSKPLNVPAASSFRKNHISDDVELDGEGDFGTVVIHNVDKTDKTIIKTQPSNGKEPSTLLGHVEAPLLSVTGGISAETRADTRVGNNILAESQPVAQTVRASSPLTSVSSEEILKINNTSQGKFGSGRDISSGTLKNETISKKAFALQDKLWSIYAAGNTVPIPFLRATDISPIALLSDNVVGAMQLDDSGTVAVEALQELFTGDGQSKKGRRGLNEMPLPPSVYQRLTSSSTLMNLAQALAYHRMCYEEMPLQELQATQEQQTIQNLYSTSLQRMESEMNHALTEKLVISESELRYKSIQNSVPKVGDGGDGGGVVLQGCSWGDQALSIAHDVLFLHAADDIKLYAFKTTPRGYVYVRLDKLSHKYGCPSMEELESFSQEYKKRLDEVGALGQIPDDLALEVSTPGAERILKVPDDLSRFKDMPMRVCYVDEEESDCMENNGVFLLESIEMDSDKCVWKLADVKENRDVQSKGRPLSRKQKDWRLNLPFAKHRMVTLYLDC
ncbi:hypothetical protein JRO89_XS05G0027100 [Xanthoceras sorbifolium]|uniref:non-specific serine/threonine protein kinase n=3 Tax=Magnoliopsida TaxID=3398 RepID=A0ABQ8I021_9ROSI|nr:hypothetical protein JRO89_XS05G0027100 [Xanthoceras sorbifolium]